MTINITPPSHNSEHLTHPKYRADIDGLRAIAILSVVGFHAFPFSVKGGFIGVDIFFIISGFLISTIIIGSLERNSFSFIEFYSRRIRRIFPALALVLMASFAFGWFVLTANEYMQLGKHIVGGAGFFSNILFWRESGYWDSAAETKPLLHLWSLGIEEQYYIVWPLLLWLAWKRRFNLLAVAIAIAVVSFALNIGIVRSHAVAAFYSPPTRFWELLAGSVLAHMTLHKQNVFPKFKHKIDAWLNSMFYAQAPEANGKTLRNVQSVFGATLIAIGVFVITKDRYFPGWWAVLPTLGTVLIISAGAQSWLNRAVLSNRVLVWFGLISFPLYLWHWPLLSFARILESGTPTREIRIIIILVAIILAWLTYRLIEKPIRFGSHGKAKTITLLVLMAVVGFVGYYDYKRQGFGFRFPKILNEFMSYKFEFHDAFRVGTCLLRPDQRYSAFNACESPGEEIKKQSFLLWGDSHAAHLYSGYQASFGEDVKIIQRSGMSCPPILNYDNAATPHCKEINDAIFQSIKNKKPNKVILAAAWVSYDWKQVEGTITQLRAIGITNIDLIGPVPFWIDGLPTQLCRRFRYDVFHRIYQNSNSDALQRIPERMTLGLNPNAIQLDPLMAEFAKQLKVNYISPIKILCNEEGCLTRLGETSDTLTAMDAAHLTTAGSRYLVSHFPRN